MNLLPSLMHVKIEGDKNFSLWLPLFLLWPLFIVFLPFYFLLSLVMLKGNLKRATLMLPYTYNLFADFRGTLIDVQETHQKVYISIK